LLYGPFVRVLKPLEMGNGDQLTPKLRLLGSNAGSLRSLSTAAIARKNVGDFLAGGQARIMPKTSRTQGRVSTREPFSTALWRASTRLSGSSPDQV
jgi:hypothetical protein